MTVEEVLFKRSIKKQQDSHPKTKLKTVGTYLEQTEMGLKFFYLPFLLFGIFFGPTLFGTIFLGLFFASFIGSQVIGVSIKDEFKDASDNIQKWDHKAEIKAQADSMKKIKSLPKEIEATKSRIAEKRAKLALLQATKDARKTKSVTQENHQEQ